jgi:hypothetical protein
MAAFRLPVSGLDVLFRQTTGAEDILLAEETTLDTRLALALVDALGQRADGGPVPWETLPVTDLDAALLAIRRSFIGERVSSSIVCNPVQASLSKRPKNGTASEPMAGCKARIDIAFRIDDYLAHHAPVRPRGVSLAAEPGWFHLDGVHATWRVPSCADQMAASGRPDAEQELARRCIRPATVPIRERRKLEAAMAKLAPSLYDYLGGCCPECAAPFRIAFDPQRYVLGEFRERAMFVYEEVHLIAARYRWSETEILALPRARRARYAEFAHEAMAGA